MAEGAGPEPPLHGPIIFGNVRADLCETRAFERVYARSFLFGPD